jgi:probable H4MPT-linked C1 transfer pathway protein
MIENDAMFEMNNESGRLQDWVAFDVGGANIKAAHSTGRTLSIPFEVWKHPEDLSDAIARLASALPPSQNLALTMTAELCDCFPTKAIGVNSIVDSVVRAMPGREVRIWCIDQQFHTIAEVRHQPLLAAAANWLALATLCARMIPEQRGLLIDIGSTTTDLIALDRGRPVPIGRTDTERLRSGELVYAGVRRTPLCALATELEFQGEPTGLAAEFFASTLDVYLTLGEIAPDPSDLSTADGRPATVAHARESLARMVGADREGFSMEDALNLAAAADQVLTDRLLRSAARVCDSRIGRPDCVLVAGSGEFLARSFAERLLEPHGQIIGLKESWGEIGSSAGCAYSLVILASGRMPKIRSLVGA